MGRFTFVLLIAVCPLVAFQYPGQVPPGQYPPGQYPPGQYPGGRYPGGGGLSLPSKGHKKNQKQKETEQQPTIEADGLTVSNDGKQLRVATQDGRTLTMTIAPTTKWVRSGSDIDANKVIPRTTVHVVAAEDDEAFLTAVNVSLLKDAPTESPETQGRPTIARARTTTPDDEEMARPTILKAPDAPGRPELRHGKPTNPDATDDSSPAASEASNSAGLSKATTPTAAKPSSDGPVDFTIGSESPAAKQHTNAYDQLIDRTREWAMSFTNGLPNFLCQQSTTRYVEQSRSEGFEPVDVVTAKVLYEDGREKYSEITVGGKRTNKSMMEIGGTTSTGEFASVLGGLFQEGSQSRVQVLPIDDGGARTRSDLRLQGSATQFKLDDSGGRPNAAASLQREHLDRQGHCPGEANRNAGRQHPEGFSGRHCGVGGRLRRGSARHK